MYRMDLGRKRVAGGCFSVSEVTGFGGGQDDGNGDDVRRVAAVFEMWNLGLGVDEI